MDTEQDLLGVPELAKILNTTESAVRTRLARGVGVPKRYEESTKVLWLRSDVDKYLEDMV
jgi:hypothetical protein